MENFQVIGHVELPTNLVEQNEVVDFLYKTFLEKFQGPFQVSFIEVRYPGWGNQNWHIDDGLLDVERMAIWTNMYPTEIRLPDKTIVHGTPGDVVLWHNFVCEHRTPPEAIKQIRENRSENRWIVRMGCFTPVEKVKIRRVKATITL